MTEHFTMAWSSLSSKFFFSLGSESRFNLNFRVHLQGSFVECLNMLKIVITNPGVVSQKNPDRICRQGTFSGVSGQFNFNKFCLQEHLVQKFYQNCVLYQHLLYQNEVKNENINCSKVLNVQKKSFREHFALRNIWFKILQMII